MTSLYPSLWRFVLGLGLSILMGWIALTWVAPLGFMDHPEGRKCHLGDIPRTGGLAFVITILVGLVFQVCAIPLTPLQWVGVAVMAGMGLVDDGCCLRARYKALIGLAVSGALAYGGAHSLVSQNLDIHLLGQNLPISFGLYFTLLCLYYWCVPQSFNLVDGLNGLAMGYAGVVLIALGVTGHPHPFTMGAVMGLLVWNWPRARHFLGDCGSMSIGLLLALLVKKAFAHQEPNLILWVFAYPLLDTSMVVVVRIAKGLHPAMADRSHLHHRWEDLLGRRRGWAVAIILVQAAACISAVAVRGWGWSIPIAGLVALVGQAIWFSARDLRSHRKNRVIILGESPKLAAERQ